MSVPRAVVFDLYGTLLRIARPVFQREVSRLPPPARRAWVSFERDTLVVTPYDSHDEFVRVILERFHPDAGPERQAQALALLGQELDSVELFPGVRTLLQFLKRRGLRLGVLSNAASPYREPPARLGLSELFEAAVFSCDEGLRKPDPRLFAAICARLGVAPAEAVMVGDSLVNDARAAIAAGLRAVLVGRARAAGGGGRQPVPAPVQAPAPRVVQAAAELAWWRLDAEPWDEPLLPPGEPLALAGRSGEMEALAPLADAEQGRYNLVARAAVRFAGDAARTVYVKRFLHPAAADVEELVHALLPELGIAACPIGVCRGKEPLLVAAAAPGEKLSEAGAVVDAALAHEIGRHFACGFLLANADLRPRNAFLERAAGGPRLVMVDHEYCLLDRALDLDGLADPFDRHAIEALGEAELQRRVARLVLTPQTMRRARRQFFELRRGAGELAEAFRVGWVEVHRRAQRNAAAIRQRVAERLERQPALIAGTLAYRRALTRFDLDDLMRRIGLEPEAACAPCLQLPGAAAGATAP